MATFLMTDLEGSTRQWQVAPDAMRAAVVRHEEVIKKAVEANAGRLLQDRGEGDSTLSVFDSPEAAVRAALDAQLGLHAEPWPTPTPLRARIAVHSGRALASDDDHLGPEVNRCARIRSLARGGQTLISSTTVAALTDEIAMKVLRPLGLRRLKDFEDPLELFLLTHPALGDAHGAGSAVAGPNNLPATITTFVGRRAELDRLGEVLASQRLVTLLGPGGTGKTRLAIEGATAVAERSPDGVWFVDLAPLTDPAHIASATAEVLGIDERPGDPRGTVLDYLEPRNALLIVDNCEHLVAGAATLVDEVIRTCPLVRVIATSREPLRVHGECQFRLQPLETHGITDDPSDAVRLFVERRKLVDWDFELNAANAGTVVELCQSLDGLPLAIELAAAQAPGVSVDRLRTAIGTRLASLGIDSSIGPDRHRTLHELIDWSVKLLSPPEQQMFRNLSIFAGSFDAAAAADVYGDDMTIDEAWDMLRALATKSLLVLADSGVATERYRMLDTLRECGRASLREHGELEETSRCYVEWCAAVADQGVHLIKVDIALALDVNRENLRHALEIALRDDVEMSTRLVLGLEQYWVLRGAFSEGERAARNALRLAGTAYPSERAQLLRVAGRFAFMLDRLEEARGFLEEGLTLLVDSDFDPLRARTLGLLARVLTYQGDATRAMAISAEGVEAARRLGDPWQVGDVLIDYGEAALAAGNRKQARDAFAEALPLIQTRDDTPWQLGGCLFWLATVTDEPREAERLIREAVLPFRELGIVGNIAIFDAVLARNLLSQNRTVETLPLFEEALTLLLDIGGVKDLFDTLREAARVLARTGYPQEAARVLGAAEAHEQASEHARLVGEQELWDVAEAEVCSSLPSDVSVRLKSEGAAMSLEEAATYTLQLVRHLMSDLEPTRRVTLDGSGRNE